MCTNLYCDQGINNGGRVFCRIDVSEGTLNLSWRGLAGAGFGAVCTRTPLSISALVTTICVFGLLNAVFCIYLVYGVLRPIRAREDEGRRPEILP